MAPMLKRSGQTEPEYELKHRITGAIILVTVAVLIVPFLLVEPNPQGQPSPEAPGQPASIYRSKVTPLDLSTVTHKTEQTSRDEPAKTIPAERELVSLDVSGEVVVPDSKEPDLPRNRPDSPSSSVLSSDPSQSTLIMTPISDESGKPARTEVASVEPERARNQEGWFVRVGTYAKKTNVDFVVDLLQQNGYQPQTKPITTSGGAPHGSG